MSIPGDAFEAGIQIAVTLECDGVPSALGGALAYGQYGIPRATNDVDVFVAPAQPDPVFAALRSLGVAVQGAAVVAARRRDRTGTHAGQSLHPSAATIAW